MEHRPDGQITLERFEGGLDLDQLQVELPQLRWIRLGEVGAQQIASFAAANLPELRAIEPISETGIALNDRDCDEPPRGRCLRLRRSKLHEQLLG